MNKLQLESFVRESNKIEGIFRDPMPIEIDAHRIFFALPVVTVEDLKSFVLFCQPDAVLRDKQGLNVRVGNHIPQPGGKMIYYELVGICLDLEFMKPYEAHVEYETLHPFTDCNGRSGRALWAWHMNELELSTELGFLHTFYYQSLAESGR